MQLVEPDQPVRTWSAVSVKILNADVYIRDRQAKKTVS